MTTIDTFNAKRELSIGGHYFSLSGLDENGIDTSHLPYSIRILLEGAVRGNDGFLVTEQDVRNIASWQANGERGEIPFHLLELFFRTSLAYQQLLIWQHFEMQWWRWVEMQKK